MNRKTIARNGEAFNKLNDSVAVTGVARSGTTILGKIIHSLQNVEYFFEPPMYIPIMHTEYGEDRKFLLESYLYEDCLLGGLAGRCINTNEKDDSSVFAVKDQRDVHFRLQRSFRRSELVEIAKDKILAFKVPSAALELVLYKSWWPNSKLIFMHRRPSEVIVSLLRKKWLSPKHASQSGLWPWKSIGDISVPWWVPDERAEEYFGLCEVDRCAFYYLQTVKVAEAEAKFSWLKYDDLVGCSQKLLNSICEIVGVAPGKKTYEVVAGIRKRSPDRSRSILGHISTEFSDITAYEN